MTYTMDEAALLAMAGIALDCHLRRKIPGLAFPEPTEYVTLVIHRVVNAMLAAGLTALRGGVK